MEPLPKSALPPTIGSSRRRPLWPAAVGALVLAVVIVGVWLAARPRGPASRLPSLGSTAPPADPRLTYTGPFENVRPEVDYVGSDACTNCHKAKARSFAQHPMGRSLTPLDRFVSPPDDPAHHNPFTAFDRTFRVVRQDGRVLHRQEGPTGPDGRPVYTFDLPADYAIGSGTRGYSFLTERDGYVFQTPISWYAQKHIWDVSPMFGEDYLSGRPIQTECLFCHANQVRPRPNFVNRYERPVFQGHAIGCERCHGPGQRHIQAREQSEAVEGVDHTIVNPRRLRWQLREAVCEQCHLEGEMRVLHRGRDFHEYRPGLPQSAILSVFVPTETSAEGQKAVSHVEQMYASRCFQSSSDADKLGCISCHDPHQRVAPERRIAHYRRRCLTCHEEHDCSKPRPERLRESPQDSCIQCHMPRYSASDIPHTAATDHRIPRRPGQGGQLPAAEERAIAGLPLASFYLQEDGPELRRDLGIALTRLLGAKHPSAMAFSTRVLMLLENAVRRGSEDTEAWLSKARVLYAQGQLDEALATAESILARLPDHEETVVVAAFAAQALGQLDKTIAYWRRATAINPGVTTYRWNLIVLLARKGAWNEAGAECAVLLRQEPGNVEVRKLWLRCLLHMGKRTEARAELDRIRALRPSAIPDLERWFAEQTR